MRKLVTGAMVSLDGVMQAPGGPDEDRSNGFAYGGWVAPHWDEEGAAAIAELFAEPFELLLGRRTYDIFASYWPNVPHDAEAGDALTADIARKFNAVSKHVATHHPESLSWNSSRALGEDVVASLRELKRGQGPLLLTQGSTELLQTLLEHDLIDELRLLVFPVTLGSGKRLFGTGVRPRGLRLTRSSVTPKGVVTATYERSGEVETAAVDAVIERQERSAR